MGVGKAVGAGVGTSVGIGVGAGDVARGGVGAGVEGACKLWMKATIFSRSASLSTPVVNGGIAPLGVLACRVISSRLLPIMLGEMAVLLPSGPWQALQPSELNSCAP